MSDYGFVHDGRTFTPNATPGIQPTANDDRNATIERAELAHWKTQPAAMLAYYDFPREHKHAYAAVLNSGYYGLPAACAHCGKAPDVHAKHEQNAAQRWRTSFEPLIGSDDLRAFVTTWPGTRIGSIVSARVSTNNLGARVVALRVRGTNGADYYGRASWDNGSVIRLRKAK